MKDPQCDFPEGSANKSIDAVVVQFTNTTDFDGYNWTLSEMAYRRIVKILKRNTREGRGPGVE